METTAEASVTKEKEVRRVKIEDFNPQEAQAFLPGWEYQEIRGDDKEKLIHVGWFFTKEIGGRKWNLKIDQKVSSVTLSTQDLLEERQIKRVKEVGMNNLNGTLSFHSKKGSYYISRDGSSHYIISSDQGISSHSYFGLSQSE